MEAQVSPASTLGAIATSLNPAMIVVTTAVHGERGGCLVGFHCQAGIEPERYSIRLSKANHTCRLGLRAGFFALHFMTAQDKPLAALFGTRTGDLVDKLALVPHSLDANGIPLLQQCPHRMILQRDTLLDDGSDHVSVSGPVLSVESTGSFVPLRLADVEDLQAGHGADERPAPPTERSEVPERR